MKRKIVHVKLIRRQRNDLLTKLMVSANIHQKERIEMNGLNQTFAETTPIGYRTPAPAVFTATEQGRVFFVCRNNYKELNILKPVARLARVQALLPEFEVKESAVQFSMARARDPEYRYDLETGETITSRHGFRALGQYRKILADVKSDITGQDWMQMCTLFNQRLRDKEQMGNDIGVTHELFFKLLRDIGLRAAKDGIIREGEPLFQTKPIEEEITNVKAYFKKSVEPQIKEVIKYRGADGNDYDTYAEAEATLFPHRLAKFIQANIDLQFNDAEVLADRLLSSYNITQK